MEEYNPWPRRLFLVFICLAVAAGCAYGIYIYELHASEAKKHAEQINTLNGLKIETNDAHPVIEYGNQPIDATTLVRTTNRSNPSASVTLTADPMQITPNTIGSIDVNYTANSKDNDGNSITNTSTITFNVQDTQAPVIEVDKDPMDIEQDSPYYNQNAIVVSVKDPVDGDLPLVDKAPAASDTGYYTITSNVDLSTIGTYQVVIHAVDKSGNKTDKTVTVNIIQKTNYSEATPKPTAATNKSSSASANNSSAANTVPSNSSTTTDTTTTKTN